MQNNIHIGNFLDKLIISQGINTTKIGSFRIMNRTFTNPDKLSVKKYDFLSIYTCDNITTQGRDKNFVIPKDVDTFSVHMITKGKDMFIIDQSLIYFNHYVFLNKTNRDGNYMGYHDKSIVKHCGFLNK